MSIIRKNKTIITIVFAVFAFSALILSVFFTTPKNVSAECVFDQFIEGQYVTHTSYTDKNGNKGFAIFAHNDGVSVGLKKKFQGVFETSFVALEASDGGLGSSLIDLIFTSSSGREFSLSIRRNGADSFGYVNSNGRKMSIDQNMTGFTSMMNRAENFTSLKSANKYTVRFDPSLMTVEVNGKLIWNFSNSTNDGYYVGFTLEKFSKYDISLCFSKSCCFIHFAERISVGR